MNIAIIGSGYVGLVAGACFADGGHSVLCVDRDEAKIRGLSEGRIPIFEKGLPLLIERNMRAGRLRFTVSIAEAVSKSKVIFFAVGTPPLPGGDADLSQLREAAEQAAMAMNDYRIFVNKSTVPVGTYALVRRWIAALTEAPFDVVSNPEFLKEGSAIEDFLKPERVVIGTTNKEVYEIMADIYSPFVRQGRPVLCMHPLSAEITKYASNALLATRISFMNELSRLCENVGGDIEEVRRGMIYDSRIGPHFLYAGPGYGGSCFPKDLRALLWTARDQGLSLGIIEAAEKANDIQKQILPERVCRHFGASIRDRTIAVWGLAFKPETDDVRESPALTLIEDLLQTGARVRAYDPVATENASRVLAHRKLSYCASAMEATAGADALVIVTEWNEFRKPDFPKLKASLKLPVIFDGRNIYSPEVVRRHGFIYHAIGRMLPKEESQRAA
jgi:UDPglucose 6-dehydrogenase